MPLQHASLDAKQKAKEMAHVGGACTFSHEVNPVPTSVQFIFIYRAKIKAASGSVAELQCLLLKSVQYAATGPLPCLRVKCSRFAHWQKVKWLVLLLHSPSVRVQAALKVDGNIVTQTKH